MIKKIVGTKIYATFRGVADDFLIDFVFREQTKLLHLHFRYLYFVCVVLAAEIVPGPASTCGLRTRGLRSV